MPAPPRVLRKPARWLLLLGGLASVGLLAVAMGDFADPIQAARDELTRTARARVDLIQSAWNNQRSAADDPAPAAGVSVTLGPPTTFTGPVEASDGASRLVDVLVDAALAAAGAGDLAAAAQRAAEAVSRAPQAARAAEARLHLARWAAARQDFAEVESQRSAILSGDHASYPVGGAGGLGAGLLACLVEPVDPAAAHALLSRPAPCLPPPSDSIAIGQDRTAELRSDPLWKVLRERLAAASPELDWDAAFRVEARTTEALRTFFGDSLSATEDRWTLLTRRSALFATRAFAGGVRVLSVRPDGLVTRLRESIGPGQFKLRFDHEPALFEAGIFDGGREWLGGTSIGFTLHKAAPLAEARAEAKRQRFLRGGLIALAIAIATATALAVRAMERAARLAELRSTFVASVSHDLRTPIQSILLLAETLEKGRVATDTGRQRYFVSVRQEAQRLRRFVEDLLDGARIDRGDGARVEPRATAMEPFLDELERLLRERSDKLGAALTVQRVGLPAELDIDPDGVHRAVWNLVENALKYGHGPNEASRVTVDIAWREGLLSFVVSDTGPGIPSRYADTVFEPFERLGDQPGGISPHGRSADTGTGLGLSIVRAISRAHGGDATLEPAQAGARIRATFRTIPPSTEGPGHPGEGAA